MMQTEYYISQSEKRTKILTVSFELISSSTISSVSSSVAAVTSSDVVSNVVDAVEVSNVVDTIEVSN